MKYTILSLFLVGSFSQAYQNEFAIPAQLGMSTLSPTISTMATSGAFDKQVLQMAQEDAVKYAASNGKSGITESLLQAIEEVKAKYLAIGYQIQSEMEAVYNVMLWNAINAQIQTQKK